MTAAELIKAARDVVAAGWSQNSSARDFDGRPVPLFAGNDRARINPLAAKFSLYGAICKAGENQRQPESKLMWETLERLCRAKSGVPGGTNAVHSVIGFNDAETTSKDDMLTLMDEAVTELESLAGEAA